MKKDVFITAPLIKEIREDGTTISTDAYTFNPAKVIWMKTRQVGDDWRRPYTIIKLEETEPFMVEGDIEQYLKAIGVQDYSVYGWDLDEDEEDDES